MKKIKDETYKCIDCDKKCCSKCRDNRLNKMALAEKKFAIKFEKDQVLCIACIQKHIEQFGP